MTVGPQPNAVALWDGLALRPSPMVPLSGDSWKAAKIFVLCDRSHGGAAGVRVLSRGHLIHFDRAIEDGVGDTRTTCHVVQLPRLMNCLSLSRSH